MSTTKSKSTTKSSTQTTKRGKAQTERPWVEEGIDYGPAILAIDELVGWAFDLVDKNVATWPAARKRVQRARRHIVATLHGRRVRNPADDDVLFTASLLIRILDADLRLGLGDILTVLEELGLPTGDVPVHAYRAPTAAPRAVSPVAPIVALRPRGAVPTACVGCCHATAIRNAA